MSWASEGGVGGVGMLSREPSLVSCGIQPARLVRGSSATNHCHAAPALPTREYQGDDRRCFLDLASAFLTRPLAIPFHIRHYTPRVR